MVMAEVKQKNYFVVAATVAAELHKAMLIAREIYLTSSNARALALRAGQGAAGFQALTDFIDELARKTTVASRDINNQAVAMSRVASETARAESALNHFKVAYIKGKDSYYLKSIDSAFSRTEENYKAMRQSFNQLASNLKNALSDLARELRTATILATMSRVEASQAGKEFENSLNTIAENVSLASQSIERHVKYAQALFGDIAMSD